MRHNVLGRSSFTLLHFLVLIVHECMSSIVLVVLLAVVSSFSAIDTHCTFCHMANILLIRMNTSIIQANIWYVAPHFQQ